jgi:mannose-6-phosphate isomerase-like protein (cupin superfamily)
MSNFTTMSLPVDYDLLAPDGTEIRVLLALDRGSMAHGTLRPGQTTHAVRHRTVEETWFVLGGAAEIWRRMGERSSVETVRAGDALTIPQGTDFQFRTVGEQPFRFIMCTMPPWPGEGEAITVDGIWSATDVT